MECYVENVQQCMVYTPLAVLRPGGLRYCCEVYHRNLHALVGRLKNAVTVLNGGEEGCA